jgi:myotubularin-related protein 9
VNQQLDGGSITLKCKDLRIITLEISTPQEYLNVANSLEKLSSLAEINDLYPFFYRPMFTFLENGFTMFR